MTLSMTTQTLPGGSVVTLDMSDLGVAQIKISSGVSHPRMLSFVCYRPQQSFPVNLNDFLILTESEYPTRPLFEGFIQEVSPGDNSNLVRVTCYDPTQKVGEDVFVLSEAWVAGNPPTVATRAVPRLIFNATLPNDPDYCYSVSERATVGNIMATVMDYCVEWLSRLNGGGYESSDLNGFTFAPQEKVVFESETISAALQSMQRWIPGHKLYWYPGTRKWRWLNVYSAPEFDFTLNDFSGTYKILSFNLARSIKGRYTAITIYGPQSVTDTTFYSENGGVTLGHTAAAGDLLETYVDGTGSHANYAVTTLQVTNTLYRRIGRRLNNAVFTGSFSGYVQGPVVQFSYDNLQWYYAPCYKIDSVSGTLYLGNYRAYTQSTPPTITGSTRTFFTPPYWKITVPVLGTPLKIRYPTSGYAGTAYTIAGLINEQHTYDEMLCLGFDELGTPLTSDERLAEYLIYLQTLVRQHMDLIHTGGVVLDGLHYDFLIPYARINLHGKDGDGEDLVLGWEEIGALVTDVEIDMAEQTTTIQFSSDQADLVGWDPSALKAELKIKALQQREVGGYVAHYQSVSGDKFGMKDGSMFTGTTEFHSSYAFDPNDPMGRGQQLHR